MPTFFDRFFKNGSGEKQDSLDSPTKETPVVSKSLEEAPDKNLIRLSWAKGQAEEYKYNSDNLIDAILNKIRVKHTVQVQIFGNKEVFVTFSPPPELMKGYGNDTLFFPSNIHLLDRLIEGNFISYDKDIEKFFAPMLLRYKEHHSASKKRS